MSLQVLRDGDRLRLRLNRPEARNALNNATLHALLAELDHAPRDAQLRCTVLEGEGATQRFTARAKGRGAKIVKQTCHIFVTVGDK